MVHCSVFLTELHTLGTSTLVAKLNFILVLVQLPETLNFRFTQIQIIQ